MRCLVTGASGFIGANLVRELRARGHEITALVRRPATAATLQGLRINVVEGDVTDHARVTEALRDCEWCFHVAANYRLWLRDYAPMYATNVEGTRTVMECAARAGCSRIIYTSTVGCIGVPPHNGNLPVTADETTPISALELNNHYKRSKWQAEQIALQFARKGVPVVVVNPSAPFGPYDSKPTPTGQVVVDFLNRRMPAYLDTGLNWVHVRDVAVGHVLAAEKGRVGERYILGNTEGNWTMQHAFAVLEKITGVPAPRRKLPYSVALGAAYCNQLLSAITRTPPRAPLSGVRMARHKMFVNPSKAITQLGLPQTPPDQALADAAAWFWANGYAKKPS